MIEGKNHMYWGQLITKCLFGILNSSRKWKRKLPNYYGTSSWVVFVHFLEELKTPKIYFEINWPLLHNWVKYFFSIHWNLLCFRISWHTFSKLLWSECWGKWLYWKSFKILVRLKRISGPIVKLRVHNTYGVPFCVFMPRPPYLVEGER